MCAKKVSFIPYLRTVLGDNVSPLTSKILDYYEFRDYKFPSMWEARAWADTEMGEAMELILAKEGGWVRNNPEGKEPFSLQRFGEELGDHIMMVIVMGLALGIDPLACMEEKMRRKTEEYAKVLWGEKTYTEPEP